MRIPWQLRNLIMSIVFGSSRMPHRIWTDPRDGTRWTLWLELAGDRPVLAFGSEGTTHTVVVDFDDFLEDRSDADLQRWLDEGRRDLMGWEMHGGK